MAIIWIDGFDHYGSAANMTAYGAYAAINYSDISSTRARSGTNSLREINFTRSFGANLTTAGVGCALWFDSLPVIDNCLLFEYRDNDGNFLCRFGLSNAQEFVLYRGSGVEISRSSPGQISSGGWFHLECKFVPNGATSAIELRVNEVPVYTNNSFQCGIPAGAGGSATSAATIRFDLSSIVWSYMDDFFAWDASTSFNNTFIGDKRVATMFPDGDTAEADWTPNSGVTGYTQIDETTPDGDTTYISTATVGHISEFNFAALPANAVAISAVQIYTGARKTDAGSCSIRTDIVSAGTSTAGTTQVCTTAYLYKQNVFQTDPSTGALWTKAGVDAAKIRLEREA